MFKKIALTLAVVLAVVTMVSVPAQADPPPWYESCPTGEYFGICVYTDLGDPPITSQWIPEDVGTCINLYEWAGEFSMEDQVTAWVNNSSTDVDIQFYRDRDCDEMTGLNWWSNWSMGEFSSSASALGISSYMTRYHQ